MRAGDDAVLDLAVVDGEAEMGAGVLEAGDDRAAAGQEDLLAAELERAHAAVGNLGKRPGVEPVAVGVQRKRADEIDAGSRSPAPEPFTCSTSVISGQASSTAFFTPAWKVSAEAGHPSQAPTKRTSIAGGATFTSSTSPPCEASIGRMLASASSTRSARLALMISWRRSTA